MHEIFTVTNLQSMSPHDFDFTYHSRSNERGEWDEARETSIPIGNLTVHLIFKPALGPDEFELALIDRHGNLIHVPEITGDYDSIAKLHHDDVMDRVVRAANLRMNRVRDDFGVV